MHFLMMAVPVPPERFLHVLVLIYVCVFNFFFRLVGHLVGTILQTSRTFFSIAQLSIQNFSYLFIITPLARSSLDTAAYFSFLEIHIQAKLFPGLCFTIFRLGSYTYSTS